MHFTPDEIQAQHDRLTTTTGLVPKTVAAAVLALDPSPQMMISRQHVDGKGFRFWTVLALSGQLLTVVTGRVAEQTRWEYRSLTDPEEARVVGHRFRVHEVMSVGMENLQRYTASYSDGSITTAGTWVITMRDGRRFELPELESLPDDVTEPADFCRALMATMG